MGFRTRAGTGRGIFRVSPFINDVTRTMNGLYMDLLQNFF